MDCRTMSKAVGRFRSSGEQLALRGEVWLPDNAEMMLHSLVLGGTDPQVRAMVRWTSVEFRIGHKSAARL
jgi:hypothetical protein